ncbi:MAG: class I adenylate-forming enzyme family protein, partial [Halodesulfurarchaeum sp.]
MIEYLHRWARTAPDRPAIIDAGTTDRIRYGTLLDRAELLGRSLAIDPGDRVATVLDRRLETIVLFWGIMAGGGVVVALDPEEPADQIANQCQRAAVRQCIADSNDTARLAGALPEETNLTALSEVLKTARSQPGASGSAVFESPSRGLDRTRVILFTSGTTGQPSGIRLTGRNLGASAASTIARVGANRDDRWLLDLPVFHAGGFSIPIRTAMLGATTVLREDFDPSESAATMAEYDVTGVSLVPTMLDRLLDGPGIPDTLEFVLVGGAATPPRLVERALTANVPVYPSYGMTETASGVATATPEEVARDAETVGRPVQAADVAICDDRRTEQPSGEPGEIVVSGAIVSPG